MPDSVISEIAVEPGFDLEGFMNFIHESKISSEALEHFINLWGQWQRRLKAAQIRAGKDSWLAVRLPEEVEKEIDKAWEASPAEGFMINGLAQYLAMTAVEDLLPQVAGGGCAPSPRPAPALAEALEKLELIDPDARAGTLLRRFAILTYLPFRGGCEVCSLQENCPKGGGDYASVVLPGYERGKD